MKAHAFNSSTRSSHHGFSLVELLAAMAILAIMTTLLFAAFNQASRAWLQAENRVETFTEARAALDYMAKELSQAITTAQIPFLGDANDLAFVATTGSPNSSPDYGADMVKIVYRLNTPTPLPLLSDPFFILNSTPPNLVRRASTLTSAATASCKNYGGGACPLFPITPPWDFYNNPNWPETGDPILTQLLAENVVSLTFDYYDSGGNQYPSWNSNAANINAWQKELGVPIPQLNAVMQNRAPSRVAITLTVLDSRAAARYRVAPAAALPQILNESQRTFTTSVYIPNRQP